MSASVSGLDPRCKCRSEPGRFLFCALHAAAPDLLEALQAMAAQLDAAAVRLMSIEHFQSFAEDCERSAGCARAAIAKATGGK